LLNYNTDADLQRSDRNLEALAKQGTNVIILEVDYNFAFKSHPDLRHGTNPITRDGARKFAALCKKLGIRLIPEFQSLGPPIVEGGDLFRCSRFIQTSISHQARCLTTTGSIVASGNPNKPGSVANRLRVAGRDHRCVSGRRHTRRYGRGFFCSGSDKSPSTTGKDPGVLFANASETNFTGIWCANDTSEMLMWGDRLIDAAQYDYGEWEAAKNGTAIAIDKIPKDIIICDWHYELRDSYPSIPMFYRKGISCLAVRLEGRGRDEGIHQLQPFACWSKDARSSLHHVGCRERWAGAIPAAA
jgi:hypothetical protein